MVNCTRVEARDGVDGLPHCVVVKNRPSLKPHAPEDITQLSIPTIFGFLSNFLPQAAATASMISNGYRENTDPSLSYLLAPPITSMLEMEPWDMQGLFDLPGPVLARRLSTLLNSWLILGQTHRYAATKVGKLGEAGLNVTAEIRNWEERYHVPIDWWSVYVVASVVLLAGAIMGTVLAHSALGPEVMGYASSVLRDSKYVDIAAEDAKLDGVDLANKLGKKRFKFGFVNRPGYGVEESPLLGVAPEEDVRGLRE